MFSPRYGDLVAIASKTDGDCHLCHQPADLTLYGRTGAFGGETVTIDHLVPQSHGGSDDAANLLVAHGACNSRRGTREVEEARFELARTTSAPLGSSEKTALSALAGSAVAVVAGYGFGEDDAQGRREFNAEAALLAGIASCLFIRAVL